MIRLPRVVCVLCVSVSLLAFAPVLFADYDSDGDGMPDWWEIENGLNPSSGLSQALVAWYRFDEGAGAAVSNSASGWEGLYTGTTMNMPSPVWVAGASGRTNDKALWFDGTNDYVSIPQTPAIVTAAPFTVSALVWYDEGSQTALPTILADQSWCGFDRDTDPTNEIIHWLSPGYLLQVNSASDLIAFMAQPSCLSSAVLWGASASAWGAAHADSWTHVAGVFDGTNQLLYINGCLVGVSASVFEPSLQAALLIGMDYGHYTNSCWKGAIDDVRIYRTALSPSDITQMYDAQTDADGDGVSNYEEFLNSTNPRDGGTNAYVRDGAIDISFVPQGWAANSPTRYLAHYDDSNSGTEMHLYVEQNDILTFVVYDAHGQRHRIRFGPTDDTKGLMLNKYVVNGVTNRIVASWKNFNSGRSNAVMRLFVNGVDWQCACGNNSNPKHTAYNWYHWGLGGGYYEADQVRIDFPARTPTDADMYGSRLITNFPALVSDMAVTVHTTAYGMIGADFPSEVLPFTPATTKAPPQFDRPQVIAQSAHVAYLLKDFVCNDSVPDIAQEEWDLAAQQIAGVVDGVELCFDWRPYESPTNWANVIRNQQKLIDAGNRFGLHTALSAGSGAPNRGDVYWQVMRTHPGLTNFGGWQLSVAADGCITVVPVPQQADSRPPEINYYPSMLDWGDREAVSNYIAGWKNWLGHYTNYSYVFFNEDALWKSAWSFFEAPTYSSNSLAWFRQYLAQRYPNEDHANARFPVSIVSFQYMTNWAVPAHDRLYIHDSATNLLVETTDPAYWAKWWEWRRLVAANGIYEHAKAAHQINTANTNWKGVIRFISPADPWTEVSGVDMALEAQVPFVDWMVMENARASGYGVTRQLREEEVRLQLCDLRRVLTNGTGFGSYFQVHTYSDTNALPDLGIELDEAGFTYSIHNMTQDIAYAASDEFGSQIIVPYSIPILIDRLWMGSFQRVNYVPEAADIWNTMRFRDLWVNISNQQASSSTIYTNPVAFSWSVPEKAKGFEVQFDTSPDFSSVITTLVLATNSYAFALDGLPLQTQIYWRTRGIYHVLHIATNGSVTATGVYYGVWIVCEQPFQMADSDDDGLTDWDEAHVYGTGASSQDSDDDGLLDGDEVHVHGTDPARPDTDDDGMPDGWEVQYGLNPASGRSDDLVAWWAFNEGAGVVVSNRAGTNHSGVAVNMGPSNWVPGKSGTSTDKALLFDGISNYVDVGTSGSIGLDDVSVFAWIKVPSNVADVTRIGNIVGNFEHNPNFDFEGHQYGRLRVYWNYGERQVWSQGVDIRDDEWHLVGFVRNHAQGSLTLFVDGIPNASTDAGSAPNYLWPLRIGGDFRANPGIPFHGAIDDVRIYRAALGAQDIEDLYEAFSDLDEDGLGNVQEYVSGTSPTQPDTDADGMPDGWEVGCGLNPLLNNASQDPDDDGLINYLEYVYQTSPSDWDTDDDKYMDGWEVRAQTDPTDLNSCPILLGTDYNGDGRSDLAVCTTNAQEMLWYVRSLAPPSNVVIWGQSWGASNMVPVPGDYDGDGIADIAVYERATGDWYIRKTNYTVIAWDLNWGGANMIPVWGDYDGDKRFDLAVWQPSGWYIRAVTGASPVIAFGTNWGYAGCVPVPGDYDGDGLFDLAVCDLSNYKWYIRTLSNQVLMSGTNWGYAGCIPVPGDYDGDGKYDMAVYDKTNRTWYVRRVSGATPTFIYGLTWGVQPASSAWVIPGDYNRTTNRNYDLAVWRSTNGYWFARATNSVIVANFQWGGAGMMPVGGVR